MRLPLRPGFRRPLLGVLLALFLLPTLARAEEEPQDPVDVPVRVKAHVDEKEAADLGLWRLKLAFTVEEDVGRAYRVRLRLTAVGGDLLDLDHAPRTPTLAWKKGQRIAYEVPIPVPPPEDLPLGAALHLVLGFHDPARDRVLPPRSDGERWGDVVPVASLEAPTAQAPDDPARAAAIVARGEELAREGRKSDAWRLLETALRRADLDATKRRFRDAILRLSPLDPEPPSLLEEQILAQRIAAERNRWLREVSGRQFDQGRLFAALRLLEEVGGALAEQTGAAVIGALAEAKRAEKDILDLKVRILARATDEDKEKAAKALEHLGSGPPVLEKARAWFAEKHYARARLLLRELAVGANHDLAAEARRLQDEVEAAWLADTPPEEAKIVADAKSHPAFGRLATVASQKFLYIGPRTLVERIPAESRLRYDLSYVYLTDLFGRVPNPAGDRVTVFFKELWDFGGGQGGGKIIDIGRADPEAAGTRVDTGLLYHELTHCVDDTEPIYEGFREGLANFGAAYSFEALGQSADTVHAFASNLDAFRKDYVARDLAFWRIQNYGPSAGFFLHFADKYAKVPGGHDWRPYRRFFRAYRAIPVRDAREPYVVRALARHLMQAFGPGAFDDLVAFRFPLVASDREAVELEADAWAGGESEVARRAEELARFENSPLPRDVLTRRLVSLANRPGQEEEARAVGRELGIVYDWQVIGPFRGGGADPRARVFPPEEEIDFTKQYADGLNSCVWRRAERQGVVSIDDLGWVTFGFSYQDDTATYALTTVVVDQATDAFVHVRADDDFVLFLNDRRVEGYLQRWDASHRVWFRGPAATVPDAMRLPVHLAAGRNKLLLKVKNRHGPAGFVLAVSRRDGRAIEGMRTEAAAASGGTVAGAAKLSWKDVLDQTFRSKGPEARFDVAVGRFKVANRRLVGEATDKQVSWRKYTVRPGYPTDAPSNLLWFKAKTTEGLRDFRLRLSLLPPANQAPKVAVTFQGEGGTDGLGGWSLVVHPSGDKKVAARLERYEDLAYQTPPLELPPELLAAEEMPLLLTYHGERLTVTLGDLILFREVSILPIPGRHRIGLATWGPELGIASLELEQPAPAR